MKKTNEKVLSFMLAILMAVSTMFIGAVETKADTGKIYEPYYDAENDKVVGAPEIGTVLTPEDVIKGGDNLAENVEIYVCVHAFKEEITENARGYIIKSIEKGEQVQVSEMRTVLETGETGFTVAKIETSKLGEKTIIYIRVYANDSYEGLDNIAIEFDWSKFEAEIGGLLDMQSFKEGFVKNDKFTSKVGFELGYIYVVSPDGTEESFHGGEDVIINETDSYKFNAILFLKDGYYEEVEDTSIVVNDETVKGGVAAPSPEQSHYWATYIVVPMELGTGAELVERVEKAKQEASKPVVPPVEDNEDKDPVVPPTEDEEDAVVENDYSAKIENEAEVAEKIELTDAEKEAIANGEEVEIILDFKEVGAEAVTEEQKAIEKELGNKKVGTFLEIDLAKKIGTTETAISETTGLITITFEIPEELKNADSKVDRIYSIMRYHDGKVDKLATKYDAEKGTISFETDKFSTYAVVYEDTTINVPNTGDTTNVVMYMMLLVCGAGLLMVASKKQNRI